MSESLLRLVLISHAPLKFADVRVVCVCDRLPRTYYDFVNHQVERIASAARGEYQP